MKKFSTEEIKKAILAVEEQRLKHPPAFQPDYDKNPRLLAGRRESEKMVYEFLTEAGLEIPEFESLQAQREIELEKVVAGHKAEALRLAEERKDTLHSSILEQSRALRDLSLRGNFFPYPSFSLDTPFLIWSTPLLQFDSAAVPFASSAKFRFKTSKYKGTQKIGFYFYWANPYSDYAVINASTFISAVGHMKSHAPWTIGVNTSLVGAWARFGLWFGFPQQAESTSYESVFLGNTGAFGQTFVGGNTNAISISSGVNLNKTMFPVPPGKVVVFEAALAVEYENDEGDIDADFQSGDFKIGCPVVVFSLLNSPAPLMS